MRDTGIEVGSLGICRSSACDVRVRLDDGRSVVRKVKVPELEGLHHRVSRWPQAFRPAGYDFGEGILDCPSY